jgi:hypothetical protein
MSVGNLSQVGKSCTWGERTNLQHGLRCTVYGRWAHQAHLPCRRHRRHLREKQEAEKDFLCGGG